MKKLVFILFVAFYSLTATGFSINLHYCLGELAEIEFFGHENNCCCGEEEAMTECCDDESLELSSTDQQLLTSINYDFNGAYAIKEVSYEIQNINWVQKDENYVAFADLSPPKNQPIWLINCNLTFYG